MVGGIWPRPCARLARHIDSSKEEKTVSCSLCIFLISLYFAVLELCVPRVRLFVSLSGVWAIVMRSMDPSQQRKAGDIFPRRRFDLEIPFSASSRPLKKKAPKGEARG